ncbi:MAG: hypothetical protein WA373_01750, partial [Burkholderiales bacterium]
MQITLLRGSTLRSSACTRRGFIGVLSSRPAAAMRSARSRLRCAIASRCSRLRGQPDLDGIVAPDLLRVDLDLHDRHVGRNDAVIVERGELGEPRACGENQVRALQQRLRLGRARAPDRPHHQRVAGRDRVVARIRGHHPGREHPGELQEFTLCTRIAHA